MSDIPVMISRQDQAKSQKDNDNIKHGSDLPLPTLIEAVDRGDVKLVELILDRGADINKKDYSYDSEGPTALSLAMSGLQFQTQMGVAMTGIV